MDEIVYSLELYDEFANERANEYLQKGWKLLHVGPKTIDSGDGEAHHYTAYVVGATKEQVELLKQEESTPDEFLKFVNGIDF